MEKSAHPVPYVTDEYIGFPTLLRQIVFTKSFTYTLKVFLSEANLKMYKDFKGLSSTNPKFGHAKQTQNKGKGMPLLVLRRAYGFGFGDTSFTKIYKCMLSPESSDRVYHKVDECLLAEVRKRSFPSYVRFRLKFETIEVVLILHRRYPIADFSVGGKRFRFLRDRSFFDLAGRFSTELFLLGMEQTSLIDNITSDLKVDKNNELLGNSLLNIVAPVSFRPLAEFMSPYKLGQLNNVILRIGNDHRSSTFSLVPNGMCDLDDNASVDFESIAILCAALVLNLHDEIEQNARRNKK